MTWRGQELQDARAVSVVKVPKAQVEEMMARSGRHGLVVDRMDRGKDAIAEDYAKIKLPIEWTAADAFEKIDALPSSTKKALRGLVPTYKGYALRVLKEAEAAVVREILPELAEQMGPALGIRTTSTWIIRGLPRHSTREAIIKTFAAVNAAWEGWTVVPRKQQGQPRNGRVDWLVDAAADPPRKSLTLNHDCIYVDRYFEAQRIPAKAAPWYKLYDHDEKYEEATKQGGLWADYGIPADDDDHEDLKDDIDQTDKDDRLDDVNFPTLSAGAVAYPTPKAAPRPHNMEATGVTRRMQAAGFRVAPYATPQRTQLEVAPHTPTDDAKSDKILEMLEKLREDGNKKDALIAQLQNTIAGLNQQLAEMSRMLAEQQQRQTQQIGGANCQSGAGTNGGAQELDIATPRNETQEHGFW